MFLQLPTIPKAVIEDTLDIMPQPNVSGEGVVKMLFRDSQSGSRAEITMTLEAWDALMRSWADKRECVRKMPAGQQIERTRSFARCQKK